MTTRTLAPVLPIEARRRAWDKVWRKLLAPPATDKPATDKPADNDNAPADGERR